MTDWTARFTAPAAALDAAPLLRRETALETGHGDVVSATLRLSAIDGELVLDIADDGSGAGARGHAGIGLRSMLERAEELGGAVEVVPVPGEGTRVHATIPLRGAADV